MIKVFLSGINGKMGKSIIECCNNFSNLEIVAGLDITPNAQFPTFSCAEDVNIDFDVIIDFSRPSTLDSLISLATAKRKPIVIATTGYTEGELAKIKALSKIVPIFMSGNMSVGVNVLTNILDNAIRSLGENWDIEIIEKHHKMKVDSPSGTAKMIADCANNAIDNKGKLVSGRYGNDTLRQKNEIGIQSVRGGTIVGEHEVMLIGEDEIITISHSALSRKIFANGSLRASEYLTTVKPGMYDMKSMLNQ